jgi:hypothetical protein
LHPSHVAADLLSGNAKSSTANDADNSTGLTALANDANDGRGGDDEASDPASMPRSRSSSDLTSPPVHPAMAQQVQPDTPTPDKFTGCLKIMHSIDIPVKAAGLAYHYIVVREALKENMLIDVEDVDGSAQIDTVFTLEDKPLVGGTELQIHEIPVEQTSSNHKPTNRTHPNTNNIHYKLILE